MQDEYALGLALEPKEGSGIVGRKGVNPKVPPKDKGIESCTGEGAVMRFMAQRLDIKTGQPLDQEYQGQREFMIVYYLEDDTISIHEPQVNTNTTPPFLLAFSYSFFSFLFFCRTQSIVLLSLIWKKKKKKESPPIN
jgi:hypothetical protein